MGRNQFEQNSEAQEFMELGDKVHTILPPLAEGYRYELVALSKGRHAVTVEQNAHRSGKLSLSDIRKENTEPKKYPEVEGCGCSPYQGCATCGRYQGDGLNSPESRTLRHRD